MQVLMKSFSYLKHMLSLEVCVRCYFTYRCNFKSYNVKVDCFSKCNETWVKQNWNRLMSNFRPFFSFCSKLPELLHVTFPSFIEHCPDNFFTDFRFVFGKNEAKKSSRRRL